MWHVIVSWFVSDTQIPAAATPLCSGSRSLAVLCKLQQNVDCLLQLSQFSMTDFVLVAFGLSSFLLLPSLGFLERPCGIQQDSDQMSQPHEVCDRKMHRPVAVCLSVDQVSRFSIDIPLFTDPIEHVLWDGSKIGIPR